MKAKDYIIIGGAIAIYLLWKNSKNKKVSTSVATNGGITTGGGTATGGVTSAPPTSNEPEQIFGASLPSGMDLPVLTAGTGVATEVAVQQGLGNTTPTPAIVPIKEFGTSEVLILGGIKPIKKDIVGETEILELPYTPIIPIPKPTLTPAEPLNL
jgi:hypothetical protein